MRIGCVSNGYLPDINKFYSLAPHPRGEIQSDRMTDLQTITKHLRARRTQFARLYGVRRLGIFGSMARGDQTRSSDVDILVDFAKPVGLFTFIELEDKLRKLLKRKVDLVTPRALKSVIRKDVLSETVYV